MKIEVKRIGLFSVVKTLFLLGGIAGFLGGLLQWSLLAMLSGMTEQMPADLYGLEQQAFAELLNAGIGALGILLPFLGAMAGAMGGVVFGTILSLAYNLAARLWGGLELEWTEVAAHATAPILPKAETPGAATPLPYVPQPGPPTAPPPSPERRPPTIYE